MLWIKSFHIIFMVTWFAGLFYLPRLFVYHAQNPGEETVALFKTMERRLLVMTHIGAALTVIFGGWMLALSWNSYMSQGWMHFKLLLVVALLGYHFWCYKLVQTFRMDQNHHNEKWYRWFNEAPSLLLVLIVIMVVIKPF